MSAACLIRLCASVEDPAALARVRDALLSLTAWSADISTRAVRLDAASRYHELDLPTGVTEHLICALGSAAIYYVTMCLDDERALLESFAERVVGELALAAAIAPRRSTIKQQADELLASPA